jgi:dimeric dUTPase (all-alpha-NTP-PPase superfamily)
MIDLKPLIEAQRKLDILYCEKHDISYETTKDKRQLALLVELSEWANETRCFKYWSNKSASPKEVVIEEYVDALHFFLSIGIDIKTTFVLYSISSSDDKSLTEDFLSLISLFVDFTKTRSDDDYKKAFAKFIDMSRKCGFTWKEVEEAYFKKLDINYKRQENNY